MTLKSNKYCTNHQQMEIYYQRPFYNAPKTRASKIIQFKHYQTDAPI